MIWNIDPIMLTLGPIKLGWYGMLFGIGIVLGLQLMRWIYRREGRNPDELEVLLWFVLIGTVVGMRLGHCLFYDPVHFLSNPLEILKIWQGGYASHGAAVGLIISLYIYCRGTQRPTFIWLADRLAIAAVIAGAFIRIGNFFNAEILGKPTDSMLGVVFQRVDALPRHAVQLYEAVAYLVIFIIMLQIYRRKQPLANGTLTGLYLTLIFTARFFIEFFKAPQAVFEAANHLISVGQYLSVPFVLAGIALLIRAKRSALPKKVAA
jgi:phosphatidylglycerol---prolipoprotein diacylglyceryl transferase